jgi:hypothetical protein
MIITLKNSINFVLWQGAAYDAASALNGAIGYGNSDLISAITAHLATLVAA